MSMMLNAVWSEEWGQDIVEYTLLVAFVTFTTAALFLFGAGGSLKSIWTTGGAQLSAANNAVQ